MFIGPLAIRVSHQHGRGLGSLNRSDVACSLELGDFPWNALGAPSLDRSRDVVAWHEV